MITRHTRPETVAPHINIVPAPVVPPFPAYTPHGRRSSIWTAGLRKRDDELSYPGIPLFTHRPGRLGQQEAGRRMVRRGNRRSAYSIVRTDPAQVAEEQEKSRTIQEGGLIGPARVCLLY